jgi:hypothetical protein
MTRETVLIDTPARAATVLIVVNGVSSFCQNDSIDNVVKLEVQRCHPGFRESGGMPFAGVLGAMSRSVGPVPLPVLAAVRFSVHRAVARNSRRRRPAPWSSTGTRSDRI